MTPAQLRWWQRERRRRDRARRSAGPVLRNIGHVHFSTHRPKWVSRGNSSN